MTDQYEHLQPVDAFHVFEAVHLASSVELTPVPKPALTTVQDLLDWVLNDPARNKYQKNNEAAAIRWLGRVTSRSSRR